MPEMAVRRLMEAFLRRRAEQPDDAGAGRSPGTPAAHGGRQPDSLRQGQGLHRRLQQLTAMRLPQVGCLPACSCKQACSAKH